MSKYLSYLRNALEHAEKTGLTKDCKFVIAAVFLDENDEPSHVFVESGGNKMEKYGMVSFLIDFLDGKMGEFNSSYSAEPSSSSEYSSDDIMPRPSSRKSGLNEGEKDQLASLTKRLLDKTLSKEDREKITKEIKDLMKKAINNVQSSTPLSTGSNRGTPEQQKNIEKFMKMFGKNLGDGGDFNIKDLTNLT